MRVLGLPCLLVNRAIRLVAVSAALALLSPVKAAATDQLK